MNKLKINTVFLPTNKTCEHYNISKGDIAKQFYEDKYTVDYALPQNWVNHVAELMQISHSDIVPFFVWGYAKDDNTYDMFGQPLPLTIEGYNLLSKYNHKRHRLGE